MVILNLLTRRFSRSPCVFLRPHLPFQHGRGTLSLFNVSRGCRCLPEVIQWLCWLSCLGVYLSASLPLEVTFCRVGEKVKERRQGLPAPCKAVHEKSARHSQELLGSNLWVSPSPPSEWGQGGWTRCVTSPKPHGNAVTQTQPMWMPCPVLSLHHNTVPTFPLFYYQNFPPPSCTAYQQFYGGGVKPLLVPPNFTPHSHLTSPHTATCGGSHGIAVPEFTYTRVISNFSPSVDKLVVGPFAITSVGLIPRSKNTGPKA